MTKVNDSDFGSFVRRVSLLAILTAALSVVSASAQTPTRLKGTVKTEGAPVPGVTVSAQSPSMLKTTVTDVEGSYEFLGLPSDNYRLQATLEGAYPYGVSVTVAEGIVVQDINLEMEKSLTITLSCGSPCSDEPAATPLDLPACSDYEFDEKLITSVKLGDESAGELLRRRFRQTFVLASKDTIASELLRLQAGTAEHWDYLQARASTLIANTTQPGDSPGAEPDYAHPSPRFVSWCEEQSLPPEETYFALLATLDALVESRDRRSISILQEGLETIDPFVISSCARGLMLHRVPNASTDILHSLGRLAAEEYFNTMIWLLLSEDPETQERAREALSNEGYGEEDIALQADSVREVQASWNERR